MAAWTEAEIEIVRQMYEREGASCQEISHALTGRTRNSVIGIVNRQGMRRPAPTLLSPEERDERRRQQKSQQMRRYRERIKKQREAVRASAPVTPKRNRFLPVLITSSLGVDLLDLTDSSCRYPITEASPHRFCGLTATHGRWCEAHFRVCHQSPAADQEQAA